MKKFPYIWFLPTVWALFAFLSFQFPGDEYGLFAASSAVGIWIAFVIDMPGDIHDPAFCMSIIAAGAGIMALIGWGLTALRVNSKFWFTTHVVSAIVICVLLVLSYPTFEKAMSKNGSMLAYIFCSLNLGLYVSAILTAAITGIIRIVQKVKSSKKTHLTEK